MEIKKIFEKIHKQEQEKEENFFALQLEEGKVKSAAWTIEGDTVKILKIGNEQPWESEEEILVVVDSSLPPLMNGESEPSSIIFGIPFYWIEENKVIPSKLELLKKICHEFDLKAIGFVIIPEAVVYQLKIIEGIPPTAILVNLGRRKITVTLVRLGKILGNEVVDVSGNLGEDLIEGLSRFLPQEVIPPRIILYGGEGALETEKEQLMSFPWNNFPQLNFLHLPKVEVLPSDFDISSIALAGGREIRKVEGITVVRLLKEEATEKPLGEELVLEEKEDKEKALPKEEKNLAEELGFFQGKDVSQEFYQQAVKEPSDLPSLSQSEIKKSKKIDLTYLSAFLSAFLIRMKSFFSLVFSLKNLFSIQIKKVGVLIIILLFIGGGFIFAWWYLPKAQIILWIKPQISEKDFTLMLDPKIEIIDKENLILPAEEVEVSLTGEKTRATTGTKLVGEPARGKVIIYNRTSHEKTFEAGTQIIGPNNLKFTLDEKVVIASESAGSDYTKIPGKGEVKVTAVDIGSEGNLASGTEFSVANFSKSDFVAKNEEAFSGGTSREIQVVSKTDQEKLLAELTEELKGKANTQLQEKIVSGRRLIEESITSKTIEKIFNKRIEEEANEVTLKVKMVFTALSFSEEDFQKLIEEEIKKTVPEGFEYKPEESETSFTLKNITKEGKVIFDAHFRASLFPILDLEAIKNNLTGKRPGIGQAYLGSLPQVNSYEVRIYPRFPDKIATFPRLAKNIKIEIRKK